MSTKRILLIVILLASLGIAGYQFYIAYRLQDPAFQRERTLGDARMIDTGTEVAEVDLDDLASLRPGKDGTREIKIKPEPISFEASVKEAPKSIATTYLQEVFGIMGLEPMPVVTHRMFVETDEGLIMPVYVWDQVAAFFPADDKARRMHGYHVYTYSKGPAIVVDG